MLKNKRIKGRKSSTTALNRTSRAQGEKKIAATIFLGNLLKRLSAWP